MIEAPKRAFEIQIHISGDTREDMIRALRLIDDRLSDGRVYGTMGGPHGGYYFTVEENPEQTHEKWSVEIGAWLEQRSDPCSE